MITTQNRVYPRPERPPATEESGSWGDKVQAGVRQTRLMVSGTISDHPIIAIGSALTVGVFVGWLIKRR